MKNPYRHIFQGAIITGLLRTLLLLALILSGNLLYAGQDDTRVVEVKLGGYRFIPQEIPLIAGQPTVLRLVNTDSVTPHNFTMKASGSVPEIDVDVPGGESIDVQLTPLPAGRYTFYCGNKMMFMKSHREKGMEGTLIVTPE